MRAVSIYTATSIRGRWGKNGHVGYALEYYAEGHKQPDVLFDYEPVENVNENRAELIALLYDKLWRGYSTPDRNTR